MNPRLLYIFAFLSLPLIGCANKGKDGAQASASVPSFSERLSESGGFKQDAEGSWAPTSNKRSSFELQRETPHFKGSIEKQAYQTGDYQKKSWWGKKTYEAGEYKGDTDGSRFKKQAKHQGKVAPYGDEKVAKGDPYKTHKLDYQSARESNAADIDKPRNDYAESRKRGYVPPSVIDWKEQRKLSVEQSRSILGR